MKTTFTFGFEKSPIQGRFRGVFLFLLFTLLSTLTAGARDYDLWLGSTQVTDENKDNILNETKDGQPTAKFNLGTDGEYILTLNEPTITGSHEGAKIYSEIQEWTIAGSYNMSENEQVEYGIYANKKASNPSSILLIKGDYTCYGSTRGVHVEGYIEMYSGSFKAIGGVYGVSSYDLMLVNSRESIYLESKGGEKAFESRVYWSLPDGTSIIIPEGGFYDSGKYQFYEADGTTIAKHVILSYEYQEESSYHIWLGDTEVTPENKNNILNQVDAEGNPTAKFDSDSYTLTLNNPTITDVHTFGTSNETAVIYMNMNSSMKQIQVVGTYHQSSATAQYGICCSSGWLHIGGDFTFRGTDYGLYSEKRCVLLTNVCTSNISLFGGTGAMYCPDYYQYHYLTKYLIYTPQGDRLNYASPYFCDADENIAKEAKIFHWDNLWLGSTEVLPENCNDILGDSKASYNPETKTLTLNNPTIPGIYQGSKIYGNSIGLTIKGSYLQVESESWNAFCVENSSLTLDGDFMLYGNFGAIAADNLTVKSGTLTASGLHETGIGYGYSGNTLTVKNEVNYIELQGGDKALNLYYGGGLHLAEGYAITTPGNCIFQNNVVYEADGKTEAKNVIIQNPTNPIQFYDLWVGNKHVSSLNQNDILGDGKASFNPATNTLTLNGNPTITGTTNNSKIYSKLSSLTITGSYHMTEAETWSGIYSTSGPLTLNGNFTILSKGDWLTDARGVPCLFAGNTLWATGNITLNGNITVQGQDLVFGAIYTESGNITVQGGNLQASANNTCAAWCGGTFTAKGSTESITLEGSPGAIHAGNLVINNADGQYLGYYEPEREKAYFSKTWKSVYSTEGNTGVLATRVVLRQPQAYNLWVGDTRVNETNCNDILGDGKAKFDPVTATLTLNNPTISGYYRSNGYDSKIAAEDMNLTLKGVYRMTEVDNGAWVGLQVSGGTLTTEGDFTFRGVSVGVDVTGDMSVKGHLHAVGSQHTGIRYSGTDTDKGLTLVQGFIGETKVELEGQNYANDFSSVTYHIGQSGLTLAEPDGGSIEAITYRINDSSGNRAAHAVLTLKGTANGQGTEQNPYRINSREEWAAACEDVANGVELSDKFVTLNNDIKVYQMMGTELNPFSGTFDGYGHTLTSSINQTVQGTAPFHAISGATIRDLKVAGTIKGHGYSSGLVGYVKGDGNLIQNCEVSASIGSSGGYNGGIVGHAGSYTTTLEDCVFRGGFFDASGYAVLYNGTFVGWDETGAQLTLTRCLDLSKDEPIGRGEAEPTTATNVYSTYDKSTITGNNAWTTVPQLAYKVTGSDVNLTLTGTTGASWNGNLYAAQGETLSFTVNRPNVTFTSTAGTIHQDEQDRASYTLVMPAEDVTILNQYASSFSIVKAPYEHGTVSVKDESRAGAVVGIHITPNTYYLLDEVTVKDDDNNEYEVEIDGEYGYFTMPNSDVTVTVTFKKQYSFENGVLHLKYGDFHIINRLAFDSDVIGHETEVTKVIADEGVRFTQSCATLFQNFENCTEMDLSNVNTSGLVTTADMFYGCTNLQKLNLTGWETRQIDYMNSMFEGCSNLRELDLSGFHVSDGTGTTKMFDGAGICKLTLPAGMTVTKEMELNKGRTYKNTYEGTWSNGTWSYSGWTVLGANGEVVSTVEADDNNSNFTYAVIPAPPVAMTFVWKHTADDFILELPDGQNNSKTIADWNGITTNVQLTDRKLYKDGDWNTICLPFLLGSPEILSFFGSDVDIRALDIESRVNAQDQSSEGEDPDEGEDPEEGENPDGGEDPDEDDAPYQTRFDETTGTLCLYFTPQYNVTDITPGEPYLIKWPNDPEHPYIENPMFTNVTIDISSDEANVSKTVTSHDGKVSFVGTYAPISFSSENKSVLFMGGNNTLYYPEAGATIGPNRAYFTVDLSCGAEVKAFKLNFGDKETGLTPNPSPMREGSAGAWYDLQGRKVSPSPNPSPVRAGRKLPRGVYIHNGKKVVIK